MGASRQFLDCSAAILAGGLSSRLGCDKAFLRLEDASILEHQWHRLRRLFEHVFVVTKQPARLSWLGVPAVADALAFASPAVGVYTALLASPTQRVLCLACDLPFVPERLLCDLAQNSRGFQVYLPRHGSFVEPLCAVYAKDVASIIGTQLVRGVYRLQALLEQAQTGYLDVAEGDYGPPREIFANLNTPSDLAEAFGRRGAASSQDKAARVRDFMRRIPLPVISFVGRKKSGKTTVLERVVTVLQQRGLRVAVLKHHTHEVDYDTPGTDSYKLRRAGASVVGLCGDSQYFYAGRPGRTVSLEEHIWRLPEPVDLVLTEGFKREDAPKIEVLRKGEPPSLLCDLAELLAVVCDQELPELGLPRFEPLDGESIADFVAWWARERWPGVHMDLGSEPCQRDLRC